RKGLRKLLDKTRALRTRPHETHIPANHIKELRNLIKPVFANESTDARHTRVILAGPLRSRPLLRVRPHRSEFQHLERAAHSTDPGLPIDDRALRIKANRNS